MALQFKNNASTTLSGSINNTQTSITVINGSNFPVVSAGTDYFFATLYEVSGANEINIEIVKVTATSGNIWTIERAQDGTTGRARDGIVTCYVELRYTAASAQEMLQKALNLGDLPNAATARTNLGLGNMATQSASSVAITGGTISGVTLTSLDSTTSIVDNADNTKKVVFEVSGVTTATTRTLTIPNASGTIALTSDLTAGYQPLDSDLTAIAALAANGLVARTGTGTAAIRSLAAPTAGFTITNSDGVAGNPTFVLANDLAAVEGITATGFVKRTAADTWTAATIADGDVPTALTGKTYNGLTLTNNVTGFALAGGSTTSKTLTVQNSITLAGTDATTITLPATTGTVALNNQTFFLGTTSVAINRGSGAISLSGVSIDGSAGSATSATSATTATNIASGALGSLPYQSAAGTTALLAPNTTATRNFLRMTGTGTVGAAPAWDTITKSDVGLGSVENTALSTWAGSANITTLGTVATGTWSATAIAVARGGTGATTAAAGFNALSPITTLGDLIYGSAANTSSRLAGNATTTRKFLRQSGDGTNSAAPAWDTLQDSDIPNLTGKTYNALTLTANATGFQVAGGTTSKTLVVSNSLTLSGTDSSTLNIGGGGTLGTAAFTASTAYAPAAGSTSVVTLGTVGTGTWQASTIGLSYGGTGATTKAGAFNALSPMTTLGDIEYHDGTNGVRLAGNTTTSKRFLTQTGNGTVSAAPGWNAIVDGDLPSALTGKTYNALSLTAAAAGFTIAGGTTSKTLTVSNTLTLAGTDSSTLNIGTGGTLGTAAFTASTAYAPAAGSTSVVTLGTVTSGTWNASTVGAAYGGTGLTSYTAGDLIYASAGTTLTKLAKGSANQVLTMNSGATAPQWTTLDLSYLTNTSFKQPARVATTAALTASFAANVLTNTGTLAALVLDGVTMALNDRVLVKNQTATEQNGIYTVTAVGSGVAAWTLTRAADADTAAELAGAAISVSDGTTNGGLMFDTDFKSSGTLNTTGVTFSRMVDEALLGAWAGSSNITTVGTITTGTWSGTAIVDGKIASALTGKTYNGLSLTAAATGFTIAGGTTSKTLTVNNTLALSGTDSSTLNIGAGGTLGSAAFTASTAYAPAAGSSSITTLGVIGSGTWQGGTIGVSYGGTGSATAAGARTNLGLAIGTDVQAYDADLAAIAALAGTTGLLRKTAANTWSLDTASYLTANQTITLSSDVQGSGSTSIASTLTYFRAPVRAATTANITLIGTQTIDGVVLAVGDRVLVKDQTAASQNGIYVVASGGAWSRATDSATAALLVPGTVVTVTEGTANAETVWALDATAPITVGTTSLAYVQLSGLGRVSVGNGLSKSGNTLSLDADLAAIAALAGTTGLLKKTAADTWSLDTTAYLTSSSGVTTFSAGTTGLTPSTATSGAITLGGTLIVANGGTGATTAAAALANLGGSTRAGFATNPEYSLKAVDSRTITNPTTGIGYVGGGRFRFAALDDAASPYADVIDLSTYTDSSGGGFNSLYFGKSSQVIRHKYAAADATSWTTKTVAYTDSNITGTAAGLSATLAVASGGTGATDAATARTNLGVAIGSNVQAWDADLDAIAALAGTSGFLKKTAANSWSLDTSTYLTTAVTSFSAGTTGLTPSTATTGAVTLAGTLALANGGTGATDAATARTNLGLAIGTNVQAYDADLAAIAGLAGTSGFLKKTAANTWSLDTSTYLTGNQSITLSGDVSGSGATSIAVTLATVTAAKGGTGQTSYTIGDLLYASSTSALSKLAGVATGNALISGGVGTAPSWGKVGLTTHISGTLAVGNGGTGAATLTGLVKGNGTSAFTAAVAGTDYQAPIGTISGLVKGNGANALTAAVAGTDYVAPSALSSYAPIASPTFTGTATTPNLAFNTAGGKLTGDFSNTTALASRVSFQSSVANGSTDITVIPNGTSTRSGWGAINSSSTTNYGYFSMLALSTDMRLWSGAAGTGTVLPMKFYMGNTDAMTLDASGNLTVTGDITAKSQFGFRNRIINGKMEIAQRGTSFTSQGYTLDRWNFGHSSTAAFTVTQNTTATGEFQRNLQIQVTTADAAVAAGDYAILKQSIEGYQINDLFGKTFTLSFWVKSPKTGTHCVSFRNTGATPGTPDRSYVSTYTVNAANTWEYKTLTISGGLTSAGGWNTTNGQGLVIDWVLAAGSTYQTTAGAWQTGNFIATSAQVNCMDTVGNIFALTGVQLEAGAVATPFEHRHYGDELDRCYRYYEVAANGSVGVASRSTDGRGVTGVRFAQQKRATPSISGLSAGISGTISVDGFVYEVGLTANSSYATGYTADAEL